MGFRSSLILMPLLAVGSAAAQGQAPHVCGAGPGPNEVQAGVQPAGPGMAPTPLCYWKSQQQREQPVAPQPTGWWATTWGAIAPSPVGGVLGVAVGASSEEEARRLALADCEAKGGGSCETEFAYHNQCAVMVLGQKNYHIVGAGSVAQASEYGIEVCEERGDANCNVYYSACTEPVFHHY